MAAASAAIALSETQVTVLQQICAALGGHEEAPAAEQPPQKQRGKEAPPTTVYVKGDECLECIGDLLRAIRKDNEDTNGVIHQLGRWQIIQRDLVPIMQTYTDDKVLCCAALRLMVYMTRPIKLWTEDQAGHLAYMHEQKAALLSKAVLPAIVRMLIDAIVTPAEDRDATALEILVNVLHLFRNLAFVPDTLERGGKVYVQPAKLQDMLILRFHQERVFDVLTTLANNIDDEVKSKVRIDHLLLELFYLVFLQTTADALHAAPSTMDDVPKLARERLQQVLEQEQLMQATAAKRSVPWARHNRFGGSTWRKLLDDDTVAVKLNRKTILNHSFDDKKTARTITVRKDALMQTMFAQTEERLSLEALSCLKQLANEFIDACYHPFMSHMFRKIKETQGVVEKDRTHFFWLEAFFLRFFNLQTPSSVDTEVDENAETSPYALISVSLDLPVIRFLVDKMRFEYLMPDSKNWNMLHVCMETLKETLRMLDRMYKCKHKQSRDISMHVQHNLYYENTILDTIKELWDKYKRQTSAYLTSLVEVTHLLIRLVESFCMGKPMLYVAKTRRKRKAAAPAAPVVEHAEGEVPAEPAAIVAMEESAAQPERVTSEKMFEFKTFMERFQTDSIVSAYCELASLHQTLTPAVKLVVVKFMHKIFVECNQHVLFFKLANLVRLRQVLNTPTPDNEYLQLRNLVAYMVRQLVKMFEKNPIMHLEVLFTKNLREARKLQHGDSLDAIFGSTKKQKSEAIRKAKKVRDQVAVDQMAQDYDPTEEAAPITLTIRPPEVRAAAASKRSRKSSGGGTRKPRKGVDPNDPTGSQSYQMPSDVEDDDEDYRRAFAPSAPADRDDSDASSDDDKDDRLPPSRKAREMEDDDDDDEKDDDDDATLPALKKPREIGEDDDDDDDTLPAVRKTREIDDDDDDDNDDDDTLPPAKKPRSDDGDGSDGRGFGVDDTL